jgi:hypothetical protein
MKKNTSKLKASKNIARVLLSLNDRDLFGKFRHIEPIFAFNIRTINRALLRHKTGLETPTEK